MTIFQENQTIGKYTVQYLIKSGEVCSTYKVCDAKENAFFMKIFDDAAVPDKMRLNGEMAEIVYGRRIRNEYLIEHTEDGAFPADDGKKYVFTVSPFFTGPLLSEMMDAGKMSSLSLDDPLGIPAGILKGLLYLNENGLHHNDITPRNIILENHGDLVFTPKIIDLGHASSTVNGIPPFQVHDLNLLYCAPETLSGIYTEQSDVFSAAAVIYTIYAGKAPWSCELPQDNAYADKKKRVRKARQTPLDTDCLKGSKLNNNQLDILIRALSLNDKERPSLEAFLAGFTGEVLQQTSAHEKTRRETESKTLSQVEIKKAEGGGFDDVAGMESLKAELVNRVIWVLRDREKAEKYRLSPPNGMILYGPPGCGKTFFAEKFAEETHFNFVLVNGSDLGSIYVHGTQGKIADLFKQAEKNAPSILCFDEFDSFVPSRSSSAAEHRSEEVNEFLGQLNNCAKRGIFVIGTTNRIDLIDPAVLRKGRMDLHIEIPAPDEKTRGKIFAIHLKDRPIADDVNTDDLAQETENYAASDIAFIVNEAAMIAALADEPISQNHLLQAIRSNKSSLKPVQERRKIGF